MLLQSVCHLNQHDVLDKFQSAYRPGHNCETAIPRVLNEVLCSADGGDLMLLVFLDLGAAFDTTDHGILLTGLFDEMGMSSTAYRWFCSYLTDRTQHVTVNQSFSEDRPLTYGVLKALRWAPSSSPFAPLNLADHREA